MTVSLAQIPKAARAVAIAADLAEITESLLFGEGGARACGFQASTAAGSASSARLPH